MNMFHVKRSSLLLVLAAPAALVGATANNFIIERTGEGNINVSSANTRNLLRRLPSINANEKSFHATAVDEEQGQKDYLFEYRIGNKPVILFKTSPVKQEISIKALGTVNKIARDGDLRDALCDLRKSLLADETIDTQDDVESLDAQFHRATGLLCEWPDTLEVNFDFDQEAEIARAAASNPSPILNVEGDSTPDIPDVDKLFTRRAATESEQRNDQDESEQNHPTRRRLAYTSLCQYVKNYNIIYWVPVTHDDFWYNNGDDRTSYYAILSPPQMSPYCTYFWNNGSWVCYEPDHDPNVEYAYGECFGRCGAGCGVEYGEDSLLGGGDDMQYTQDCANHDSCVRFGHSQASFWCDDEFAFTVDDKLWAPNCF